MPVQSMALPAAGIQSMALPPASMPIPSSGMQSMPMAATTMQNMPIPVNTMRLGAMPSPGAGATGYPFTAPLSPPTAPLSPQPLQSARGGQNSALIGGAAARVAVSPVRQTASASAPASAPRAQVRAESPLGLRIMPQQLPPLPMSGRPGVQLSDEELVRNIKEILADDENMRRRAHKFFQHYDRNGDGLLNAEELGFCISELDRDLGCKQGWHTEEVNRQLRRFDRDCNGHLDVFEFEGLYRNLLLCNLNNLEPSNFSRETFLGRRQGRPEDHYNEMESLGRGCFGVVVKVICKSSGSARCMKSIDRSVCEQNGMPFNLVAEEIDKLKTLDHPAILRLFEYYVDDHHIHLITDILGGGHLLEVMKDKIMAGSPPTESWVCKIYEQVCKGIAYCHKKGVMHKDLKLDNMMLDTKDPPQAVVIDVGLAELFPPESGDVHFSATKAGTLSTMAPEVIKQHFNYKCDVWSLGCCLYGLLCKKPTAFRKPDGSLEVHPYPFLVPEDRTKESIDEFMMKQRRGPDWGNFSGGPNVRNLISRMLTYEAWQRPGMQEICAHPWFTTTAGKHQVLGKEQLQSLMNFHKANLLEHTVFIDVASQVPIEQLHEMTRIFESMDIDSSGQLDTAELTSALKEAGLEDEGAAQAAQRLTQHGSVEFSTFVAALVQSNRSLFKKHLMDAFNRLDTDGSGYITKDELQQLLEDDHLKKLEAEQATQSIFAALGDCRLIRFEQLIDYFYSGDPSPGSSRCSGASPANSKRFFSHN